jgi:MATE family multidrug resistance protein
LPKSILAGIVRLGWPVFIAQFAVMANGLIDTVMAGRYGTEDLAAVGVGASIYATLFITLMGVLFAVTPLVAQLYGANRHRAIGEEVRQTAWLAAALALLSFVLLRHPEPLLALSHLSPQVEAKVGAYLDAISWAVPAALLFRVFQGFATAVSRPRVVMTLNLAGLALKVPLNAAFMYGLGGLPALGAAGCGIATAVIAWLACTAAWLYCAREPNLARFGVFARWSWPRARAQWQLIKLGVPIGMTTLVDVTSFTFMALFVARFGAAYSGAHQIAANVAALSFMLPLALGHASSVLVGHALGAGDPQRARLTGLVGIRLGMALALGVAGVIALAGPAIASLYTADPQVRRIAAGLLLLVALYHVVDAVQAVAVNAVRAYKKTGVPMLIYVVALWGLGLGGGYVLGIAGWAGEPLRAVGFWIGAIVGMSVTAAAVTLYFLRVSRHTIAVHQRVLVDRGGAAVGSVGPGGQATGKGSPDSVVR